MTNDSPNDLAQQFYSLTPDVVLAGIEAAGLLTTGEYTQLNSYENRVFDVRLEANDASLALGERVIAKYYRPGRWSREAILEEHFFLDELKAAGIPAIAALRQSNNQTLSTYQGLHLGLFPKGLGRIPQELSGAQLASVGRLLARLHNVGEQSEPRFRPTLDVESFGWPALDLLSQFVSPEVWGRYETAAQDILMFLEDHLDESEFIRIHGDCHKGNLLQRDTREGERDFFFVDFDDFCLGPPAQDFWMLFSGDTSTRDQELHAILEGYRELRHFAASQLNLFEGLRGLRILHYAAWIARRWSDPSFPKLFPDFGSYSYWAEETEALERIAWAL